MYQRERQMKVYFSIIETLVVYCRVRITPRNPDIFEREMNCTSNLERPRNPSCKEPDILSPAGTVG